MITDKPTFPIRYAVLALPVLAAGIINAYAVPSSSKRMVFIKATTTKPKGAVSSTQKSAAQRSGADIYRQMCSSCHGANGQGGEGFKGPLRGDMSVGQLARFIQQQMPPGAPRKLPMSDAQKVANFIHGEFYSSLARARNQAARVELSRLTVRQYRNAVSDLVGSFRPTVSVDERRGLSARYFKTGAGDKPILERVDPEIRFDYANAGALPEQDDPYYFTIHWEGSVLAPDTGEYEFIVRTEQGATLWLNDQKQPLIDAQVKSGDSNEYRASLFLIGGRRYPLRLEFFKGVQGVVDLKKLKEKPPQKATLALEWKMPRRAAETIPQRCLAPSGAPQVFVPTTPFPPDDRSIGYERGTSVSKEWDDAATEAALETAGYVAANLSDLSGVADDAKERDVRLREFCRKFVTRAFRRPLSDKLATFFVDQQFKSAPSLENAVKRVVLLTLKSPRFLYREISTPEAGLQLTATAATTGAATASPAQSAPDPYDVASRLSFAMWDSLPDEELLKAAGAGQLGTREQVMAQAQRMTRDPRAWSKMKEFLLQWLKVDHYPDLAKNTKRFPKFDASVASDLRTSLELTLEQIVWGEKSDFRELMLADKFFLNGRLAQVYGAPLAADAPFQLVAMDSGKRNGVLTHPYVLASFGYLDTSSPIHRGVLIARSLLGRTLQPPPMAFTPLPATLHPKLTTRQRVALQTRPSACASCHTLINPLGFSLENYDAIGGLRAEENDMPIDTTGGYKGRDGREIKFMGSRDLTNFLAESPEVHASFVEKLFQNMVKQPVKAFGPRTMSNLQQSFKSNNFNIRRQMIEAAVVSSMYRGSATGAAKPDAAKPRTAKNGSKVATRL